MQDNLRKDRDTTVTATLFNTLYVIYLLVGVVVVYTDRDKIPRWDDTIFTILLWPFVVLAMIYVWYKERK